MRPKDDPGQDVRNDAPVAGEAPARRNPSLSLMGRQMALPRSRLVRTAIGSLLVLFGIFGFLPIVGFWMIPLGLLILANDFARVRRFNRRSNVWIQRRVRRRP